MSKRTPKRSKFIVALGAMTFGGQTNARDADRMLGMFLDEGYSWVDTAFMYTDGKSERILGRLLKGKRREQVFLATKAYPGKLGKGKPRGLTPGSVRGQLEMSLKRMRTDRVDLFYLHAPDSRTPLEVTLGACEAMRQQGKLREIGLSNYAAWQVVEAVYICRENGWKPPTVYQGMYNAVTRDVERECLVACRRFGVGFIAYNPLAGGLLTGKHATIDKVPRTGRFSGEYYRDRFWQPEYFDAVAGVAQVCRSKRTPMADAALRWIKHHAMSDGVLLGASKVEHLEQNLAACRKRPLPAAVVKAFDQAWQITRPVCQRYFRDGMNVP